MKTLRTPLLSTAAYATALLLALSPSIAAQGAAQQQGAALPAVSPQAQLALDELAPRYATQFALIQGWFRDRAVLYYDFGPVTQPVTPATVYWPIHGFDAAGNPVAIRGQRPVFSTIPGLPGYSGLWRLAYVVTADNIQPNNLQDVASIQAAVSRRKASIRETQLTLNLPVVPRGSRLERDSSNAATGWFFGREVQYFDFGQVQPSASPMWRFALGPDVAGETKILPGQNSLVDSIPIGGTYPDLWAISFVRVDTAYTPNAVKSAAALKNAGLHVDAPSSVRNLPIAFVDAGRAARAPSPLAAFADLRSPYPPTPTILTVPK